MAARRGPAPLWNGVAWARQVRIRPESSSVALSSLPIHRKPDLPRRPRFTRGPEFRSAAATPQSGPSAARPGAGSTGARRPWSRRGHAKTDLAAAPVHDEADDPGDPDSRQSWVGRLDERADAGGERALLYLHAREQPQVPLPRRPRRQIHRGERHGEAASRSCQAGLDPRAARTAARPSPLTPAGDARPGGPADEARAARRPVCRVSDRRRRSCRAARWGCRRARRRRGNGAPEPHRSRRRPPPRPA